MTEESTTRVVFVRSTARGETPLLRLRLRLSPFNVKRLSMHTLLRRFQFVSGVVLLIYLFLHLVNHALWI